VVDLEGREVQQVQVIENPYYGHHQPGQVPGFINSQGANVMLTGGMGGRAIAFFDQFGIEPVTGAGGTIQYALEQYLGGSLQGAAPCRESEEHGHGDIPPEGAYEQDEAGRLREEIEMLQQQLAQAAERLDSLTSG
jgi:predicted Fe-Mo cluster-binding NifX family protein